jgi:hypothetical protein
VGGNGKKKMNLTLYKRVKGVIISIYFLFLAKGIIGDSAY